MRALSALANFALKATACSRWNRLKSFHRVDSSKRAKDFATPVTGQVATDLQDMMVSVVQNGTGKKAKIGGFKVGGKTGTAQTDGTTKNIGWFIGFAINDKGEPVSAVCVLLEDAGDGGSSEAARIGGQIMRAAAGVGSN